MVPGASEEYVQAVVSDTAVIHWIQRTTAQRQLTSSVCTGAYILGKAGLLDNKTVTTHWGSTELLQQMTPKARVMEQTRFVDNGKRLYRRASMGPCTPSPGYGVRLTPVLSLKLSSMTTGIPKLV